jgi:microcystin-dependent protein
VTLRSYSNSAKPQTLLSDLTNSATSFEVGTVTSYPPPPFILGIDRGDTKQEVCLCTAITPGTRTFTVIRGYNTTTAVSHTTGATVELTSAAIDYFQSNRVINLLTTKGDMLVMGASTVSGNPTDIVRFAAGTNGLFLMSTSGQSHGLKWTQPVAPGVGGFYFGPSTALPSGWLACTGAAISRTTFANLFAAIGTTWGAGNGTSTFNVPKLGSVTLVGAGQGTGFTARSLAQRGGAETVALTIANLAAHGHGVSQSPHAHLTFTDNTNFQALYTDSSPAGTRLAQSSQASGTFVTFNPGNIDQGATANITIQNTGSGTAHNNMPPFVVVNFMIHQ